MKTFNQLMNMSDEQIREYIMSTTLPTLSKLVSTWPLVQQELVISKLGKVADRLDSK